MLAFTVCHMSVAHGANVGTGQAPRLLVSVTARAALGVLVGHIDHLCRSGWDVHVLVGEPTDARLLPRATLHVVPMARGRAWHRDLRSYRAVRSTIEMLRPDVVVGATPKAAALTLRAARSCGVPHRVWWVWGFRHEHDSRSLGRVVELDAGRSATHIVAASASLAEVLGRAGFDAHVLGAGSVAGVDLETFEPDPARVRGDNGAPTVVFLGRVSAAKGLEHLARIWPHVMAQSPAVRLLIAGEQDPLDPAATAQRALSGMPGVEFLGYADAVPRLLQGADLLVHPSKREGFPAAVLEAAACEVPSVVWDVTGCRDAVVDRHTGRVVGSGDDPAFGEAVIGLLSDPEQCRAMGVAARHRASALFSRQRVEANFAGFLGRLAAGHQPHEVILTEPVESRWTARLQ